MNADCKNISQCLCTKLRLHAKCMIIGNCYNVDKINVDPMTIGEKESIRVQTAVYVLVLSLTKTEIGTFNIIYYAVQFPSRIREENLIVENLF